MNQQGRPEASRTQEEGREPRQAPERLNEAATDSEDLGEIRGLCDLVTALQQTTYNRGSVFGESPAGYRMLSFKRSFDIRELAARGCGQRPTAVGGSL